jgi:hypothetical protein
MKKTKKFEDGGPTGGRYVDMGDSRVFVPDTPDAAPVAATMGQVPVGMGQDGPRAEAQLAGLGNRMGAGMVGQGPMGAGMAGMGGDSEVGYTDRPDVVARPMGLMNPPRGRGLGASLAGQAAMARMGGMKKGGTVKKMAKGGSVSSASKRGDGCAIKGKTKGRFV